MRPYLDDLDFSKLDRIYGDQPVPTWGVTGGVKIAKWARIEPNDIVLFSGNGKVFSSARITHKTHNAQLANMLWPRGDDDRQPYEWMYFLTDVQNEDIPYTRFNRAAGYKANYTIRGFGVLDKDQSERILDALRLGRTSVPSRGDYEEAVKLLGDLDEQREALARKEQSFLRKWLFGSQQQGTCGICGRTYPVDLLVAAHIKRRAECSDEEKRDYTRNVMPTCVFGCDGLFERGYVGVIDGVVVVNRAKRALVTKPVLEHLEAVKGRSCQCWDTGKAYFSWHYRHHRLDSDE
jgi:hypothetical protein